MPVTLPVQHLIKETTQFFLKSSRVFSFSSLFCFKENHDLHKWDDEVKRRISFRVLCELSSWIIVITPTSPCLERLLRVCPFGSVSIIIAVHCSAEKCFSRMPQQLKSSDSFQNEINDFSDSMMSSTGSPWLPLGPPYNSFPRNHYDTSLFIGAFITTDETHPYPSSLCNKKALSTRSLR